MGPNGAERKVVTEDHKAHEASIFRGGMPYGPDVKRLDEAYPIASLTEGLLIEHEKLSKIVKAQKGTGRYYGVIDSWRKRLREENDIVLLWRFGVGIYVAYPHERLNYSETKIRRGMRGTKRGIRFLGSVERERLDEQGQKRYDHVIHVSTVLHTALESARKQLPIGVPAIKSLPKRKVDTD
jgi:hypothetical protein